MLISCLAIQAKPYQAGRILPPASSASCKVKAREPFNPSGIWLQKGVLYEISATGSIREGSCKDSDAAGFKASDCGSPLPNVDLTLAGMEALKRDKKSNWLCLTAALYDQPSGDFKNLLAVQQFSIGRSLRLKPAASGQLVLFVNDVMTGYENNSGTLSVTIKRIQ